MSCSNVLKSNGFKLTPQRKLILDIIHSSGEHMAGDDIVNIVQARMPGVNKSTIYRTLELLVGLRCVFKSEIDNKSVYHHADEGHHHHLVCRSCGRTVACDEDVFRPVENALASQYQFHVDLKHIIISGMCGECSRKFKDNRLT